MPDATSGISSTYATSAWLYGTDSSGARTPTKALEQKDFLKLLVAQMTTQDPLNPVKDADFLAQMVQMSSLESNKAFQTELAALRSDQELQQANTLIGRAVDLQLDDGTTAHGTVSAVQIEEGTPKLIVNGQSFKLGQVVTITTPAPATQP
ncbi:MAG: flagellar hook assembly protein FlgD [Verrucomicrobia bacterium]|nr:flagellar hook assembly protein FlgD [Verrucomicrobiota bacterium]